MPSSREIFAATLRHLEPYADDIVLVGGWVHALYLANAKSGERPILTDDIDVTVPPRLMAGDRATLVELTVQAGFERDPLSDLDGATTRLTRPSLGEAVVDLDILTEAATAGAAVPVVGQDDLVAQGYPGQVIMLETWRWVEVGQEIHDSLDPPVRFRIPTVAAYTLHKGIAWRQRTQARKRAKDLVYLTEILRQPVLGAEALAGLGQLAVAYPTEYRTWRDNLAEVLTRTPLLRDVAEQLTLAGRAQGSLDEVVPAIVAQLRRALGETPEAPPL